MSLCSGCYVTALFHASCSKKDSTIYFHRFDGAGFSFQGTKDVLSSIASDAAVEDGECINAVELFWTPSDREEILFAPDMYLDFPEMITL